MTLINQKNQIIFNELKISKNFIASILRTSGAEGEDILLEELKNNKNFEVRRDIANALSYRIPKNPKYLDLQREFHFDFTIYSYYKQIYFETDFSNHLMNFNQ